MITRTELFELLKAWIATSIAFGILIYEASNGIVFSITVAALTVGLGFVAHEMSHRAVARKFGKHAEFRANNVMLLLAIAMSFLGFIIAAPGAVLIGGSVSRKENGVIACAGPVANLVVSVLFIPLLFVIPKVAFYGFMINAMLALFNMIPVPGFDGEKVFTWNKATYFSIAGVALALFIISAILPNIMTI